MRIVLPTEFREVLAELPGDLETAWYANAAEAAAAMPGAAVLWYHLDPDDALGVIEAGADLRWLTMIGAGLDRMPLEPLRRRNLIVTNGAGIAAIPIAEHTVGTMLAANRDLRSLFTAQAGAEWKPAAGGARELYGRRALIVGHGSIGRAIAERLRAFGVEVTGVRRRPDGSPGVIGPSEWRSRLPEFDWIILANPLTAETRHQIGATEIAAMKPGAWIVNIARGALIDDEALIPALREGRLGGAILDAFPTEPLPADSAYWGLENVIVTPHVSWKTTRARRRGAEMFLANLDRFRRGLPLANRVDLEAGY